MKFKVLSPKIHIYIVLRTDVNKEVKFLYKETTNVNKG